jgi:osmotically-inducible protein OsmY
MSIASKAGITTLAGAAGAAAAYLFDPQLGRTRRTQARDQLLARARRARRGAGRQGRYMAGSAAGAVKRAASQATPARPAPNDVALARKVESVIFRPEDTPKGRVSVNAENGVVFLRGELERQEQIDMLAAAAQHVDGVREVRNLLHLPGAPALSKEGGPARLKREAAPSG